MHARVARIEGTPERLDEMASQFEERTVPVLNGLEGFTGYALLGDRESGAAVAITYWQSEEALRGSEEAVKEERARAAETAEATSPQVDRFEVISQA